MHHWTVNLSLLFLFAALPAVGASTDIDPLFTSQEILEVTIVGPIAAIMEDRPTDADVPAKFRFTDPGGAAVEFDVGLRTRGRFRRDAENCQFAPLRLNIKKSQTRGTLFDKQDKLKLVTHCRNNNPRYQQVVLSEYLAYRVFNLLSDVSFSARLLRIRYVDTDAEKDDIVSLAIVIEHRDRLAERIGASEVAVQKIPKQNLIPEYSAIAGLFQYFAGNTDFSQTQGASGEDCCHNHELFEVEGERYYSVPYDFDMTGFVNAPHAGPNPRFKLRSVRQRLYRGYCLHNPYLPDAVQVFLDNRDAIYDLIISQEQLTKGTRASHIRFLNNFFSTIDNQRDIERQLIKKCI